MKNNLCARNVHLFEAELTALCRKFVIKPVIRQGEIAFVDSSDFEAHVSLDGVLRDTPEFNEHTLLPTLESLDPDEREHLEEAHNVRQLHTSVLRDINVGRIVDHGDVAGIEFADGDDGRAHCICPYCRRKEGR